MDKKPVKVESEENRAPKLGINRESEENRVLNQADIKEEETPEQIAVEQSSGSQEEEKVSTVSTRQPFTSLSQVDQDLALARALQDQERAYMLLRMGGEDSEFDSSGSGSYDYDDNYDEDEEEEGAEEGTADGEDEDDAEAGEEREDEDGELASTRSGSRSREEIDGSQFPDDESYARALQEAEDRETTAQMMALAGIHDLEEEYDSDSDDSQEDSWQDVDPDNMSYEELVALGEAVGVENKGLSSDVIASLPSSNYVADQHASSSCDEQCVICRLEYEAGDSLVGLPCKHQYHMDCIQQWLRINKVCPVCSAEVTALPENSNPTSS